MNLLNYEDFKKTDDYSKFSKENPDIGYLKVLAFAAYQALPIPNAEILITRDINNQRVVFFQGYTDNSGTITDIELPAPLTVKNVDTPEQIPQYTVYDLTAIHEGYETIKKYKIGMFGGVRVIQYIKMNPQVDLKGVDQNGN